VGTTVATADFPIEVLPTIFTYLIGDNMILVKCKLCAKEYLTWPSNRNKRLYCSKTCRYEHLRILSTGKPTFFSASGKDNPSYKNGSSYKKQCIDCGATISPRRTRCNACKSVGSLNPMYGKKNPHTEETKEILSQKFSGSNNPMFGVHRLGKDSTSYGRIWSNSDRKRLSLAHGGTGIPYEGKHNRQLFTEELKTKIRVRDNHTCQICFVCSLVPKLSVHHIDYNKDNCSENNLVSLCRKCHAKTNVNREHWKKYFKITNVEGSL